ncbi:MAG: IPT/TIG domain-containing protein [Bacteroidota bacterium]
MKNATRAALFLVCISFAYLGCTPEETPVTEVQAPTPTQTVPPTIESFSPQSAFAGEQVTILGTGFGQLPIGIQVFFGDVEAQVVSASSTKILVIVPEGAEAEKIQVKAEGGQAFSDKDFELAPTVYVGGLSSNSAVIWKNGIQEVILNQAIIREIDVVGTDIFMIGELGPNIDQAFLFKNDAFNQEVSLEIVPGTNFSRVRDLTAVGEDIIVVGFDFVNTISDPSAVLWKNGARAVLSSQFNSSIATGIFRDGNKTYIVGRDGNNGVIWENGVQKLLEKPNEFSLTNPSSVVVEGNTTYVSGYGQNLDNDQFPVVWIDGLLSYLSFSEGTTESIFSYNGDIYVAGRIQNQEGIRVACYWKNGEIVYLTDGSNDAYAYDVFIFENDVYVAGFTDNQAVIWKNGIMTSLGQGRAYSIFVK